MAGAGSGKHGLGSLLPSAFSAEQKRTEEQLTETFEGVQALVRARYANMSLVVSESDDVLAEALEQDAKHEYQMIVIGNEQVDAHAPARAPPQPPPPPPPHPFRWQPAELFLCSITVIWSLTLYSSSIIPALISTPPDNKPSSYASRRKV